MQCNLPEFGFAYSGPYEGLHNIQSRSNNVALATTPDFVILCLLEQRRVTKYKTI